MSLYLVPPVGTSVLVVLPTFEGAPPTPLPYRVTDVRDRQITLHCGAAPRGAVAASGAPCLLSWLSETKGSTREGIVVATTSTALVVDVAPDRRKHTRQPREWPVRLEVPYGSTDVIDGVAEDVSQGGMRVRAQETLEVGTRLFACLPVSGAPPIVALGEVRGVRPYQGDGGCVIRVVFTLMAPSHAARLATLLALPDFAADTEDQAQGALDRGLTAAI